MFMLLVYVTKLLTPTPKRRHGDGEVNSKREPEEYTFFINTFFHDAIN